MTFTWHGEVQPWLVGDFNGWDFSSPISLHPVGDRLWEIELSFPLDAYLEYAYVVDGKRRLDPLNPHRVNNGVGSRNNFFSMPQFKPSPFTARGKLRGTLNVHSLVDKLRLVDGQRQIILYTPDAPGPYPLLVVYDGQDYLEKARIALIVDRLVKAGLIQPVALALVPNAGQARFVEYAGNDATLSFILEKVIPLAQQKMDLVDVRDHPGAYGVLGASMGGLMALYSALRAPEVFGKVLSQGGAFRYFEQDFSVFDLLDRVRAPSNQVWLNIGRYDYDFLYEANLRMYRLLVDKESPAILKEGNGGHNYTSWRNDLPEGIKALFPPLRKYG